MTTGNNRSAASGESTTAPRERSDRDDSVLVAVPSPSEAGSPIGVAAAEGVRLGGADTGQRSWRRRTKPIVLDLRDVGRNRRGVARALREIGIRLLAADPGRYRAVCCEAGVPLLPEVDRSQLTVVSQHSQAVFEQLTLPGVAARLGAGVVYSHRECGALWGPPLLLHVTEDPEIRWAREPLRWGSGWRGSGREISRRGYSRLLMNRSLRRARVVTSTRATAADLERFHGLPADRVTVVPLGVDLDRFHPVDRGTGDAVPYLFHLSSDDPRENSAVVVQAFAGLVASSAKPIRLVIAGDLGQTRPSLLALVASLGLDGRVETPGRVSDERLVELYSGAAATVLASMDEGFGLQALEAMACGSVLVSTPAPATREIAGDAEIEWTPLESGPMAAAFQEVLRDPSRQARAAVVNRRVATRFSWDHTAQRLHELLDDMAEGAGGQFPEPVP